MDNKLCLLLTACIKPNIDEFAAFDIKRANELDRLNDYITALKLWLNYKAENIKAIVFIENSGYNLEPISDVFIQENKYDREFELLKVKASPVKKGVHYGYSELEMIDYAIKNSILLKEYQYFVKVTGRLFFPKINLLINEISINTNILIDSRRYRIYKYHQYCLTTLFVCKISFYSQYLLNSKDSLDESTPMIENLFYNILYPLYLAGFNGISMRFKHNIHPIGIRAHSNTSYTSLINVIKDIVRSIFRRTNSKIWI